MTFLQENFSAVKGFQSFISFDLIPLQRIYAKEMTVFKEELFAIAKYKNLHI
jgi:hypothetical protein